LSQEIDLRTVDRKVFTASFDSGLVDIFLSGVTLMFAVGPLTTTYLNPYLGDFWGDLLVALMYLPFWGILYLVLRWIHQKLVAPRMGVVKYGPARRKKMSLFTWIMLALNIIFVILGIVAFRNPDSPGWTITLPFTFMLLLSFSLAGYFLNLNRLYIYGIILALAPLVGEYLYQTFGAVHHGYPITYGLSTVIIFVTGLIKFITFMHHNPLPSVDPIQYEDVND